MLKGEPSRRNVIDKYNRGSASDAGFTLVELLIVIVVIAILAAVSIVAYDGIQTRATESILKSDLKNAATRLGMIKTEDGSYPTGDTAPREVTAVASEGNSFQYSGTNGSSYCLTATSSKNNAKAFHVKDGAAAKEGVCPDSNHTGPNPGGSGGGDDTVATGGPIQNLTSSQCDNMEVYNGSNPSAILTLKDSRGGTDRDYEVAKLADGNCWMLTNLKLGGSSPIVLTSADSDVTDNFTLPALTAGGSASYDNPGAYGPVPGDSGSGSTNYGYLYNWPAATAGESRTSHDKNAGNAPHSICPKGWWLPTGGSAAGVSDFSHLDQAFGGDGETGQSGSEDSWSYTGAFKGVSSALWSPMGGNFLNQGYFGGLWSSSANPSDSDSANMMMFYPDYLFVDLDRDRSSGYAVRCLLR